MKIIVFGASGGIGSHIVSLAAAAGHEVTAFARNSIDVPSGVRVVVGDVNRTSDVAAAMAGQDAVLSALGIRRERQSNPWSRLASPQDFTSKTAQVIIETMRQHGVRRVIAVSASGVGNSRPGLNWVMRFFIAYSNIGANYRDLEEMEKVYAASGLDWCCVRPVGLKDGPVSKRVGLIELFPLGAWISRADVADWMVQHLSSDLASLLCQLSVR